MAIVTNGLLAGLFFVCACAVVPGFRRVGDRTYVEAFRAINGAILNGWFLLVFFGAPVSAVVAAVLHPSGPLWGGAGFAVLTFFVTVVANVPLNRALESASIETDAGRRAARRAFEARWAWWNLVRTLTATAALAMLAVGAVLGS